MDVRDGSYIVDVAGKPGKLEAEFYQPAIYSAYETVTLVSFTHPVHPRGLYGVLHQWVRGVMYHLKPHRSSICTLTCAPTC